MKPILQSFLVLCGAASLWADPPSVLAIRNARIVTVSGPLYQQGTVVVRNGLIEAVGPQVTAPADAWVIDGAGLTVYPGLIDALSTLGLPDAAPPAPAAARGARISATPTLPGPATPPPPPARGPEDRPLTTSWVLAADTLQPSDRRLETARNAGFTTAVTFPQRGIFAGQGAVIDLNGTRAGEMVVASPAGMYTTLATNGFTSFPGSLMGSIAYLRQIFLDAEHYREAKQRYSQQPGGQKRPDYDRALEGVLSAPRFLLPAVRAYEIDRMLRLAQEWKIKPVLYGVHEAYRSADRLKQAGVPVLVSLKWPEPPRDADPAHVENLRTLELRENAPRTPAELAKANVKFAFYSDGIAAPQDALKAVRKAITAGLPQEAAVRAMTLSAAEIYGVADRLGSIEKGKIANLVVTRGDLFDDKTKVEYVIVDGVKYEPAAPAEQPANSQPTREGVRQ